MVSLVDLLESRSNGARALNWTTQDRSDRPDGDVANDSILAFPVNAG